MDLRYVFLFVGIFDGVFSSALSEGNQHDGCIIYKAIEKIVLTQEKVEQMMETSTTTESRVTAMLDDFKQALHKQEEKHDQLKRELADLKDRAVVPTIAFLAYNFDAASVHEGDTLIFKKTHFDVGSGYEPRTGIYTTPVAGVYQFSVQLYIANGQWVFFRIRTKDKIIQKTVFFDDLGSHYGTQTAVGTAVLDANTNVWIEVELSSRGNDFFLPHQHRAWNSFSGVLVNNKN